MIAGADNDGVKVSISTDALAALQADITSPNTDGLPPSVTPAPITATAVPQFDEKAFEAGMAANYARGTDLKNVARILSATMTELMGLIPALGNARFDIQTHHGQIQVTSPDLSAKDLQRVQTALNANAGLVHATRSFHDHTVDNYTLLQKAFGKPASAAQIQQASDWADANIKFMDLLQNDVGRIVRSTYQDTPGLTYRDVQGNKIDLPENPDTPVGLEAFMHRLQPLERAGVKTTVVKSGHTAVERFNDPWLLVSAILPRYTPGPDSPADVAAESA
jgi:hypothetical protein